MAPASFRRSGAFFWIRLHVQDDCDPCAQSVNITWCVWLYSQAFEMRSEGNEWKQEYHG